MINKTYIMGQGGINSLIMRRLYMLHLIKGLVNFAIKEKGMEKINVSAYDVIIKVFGVALPGDLVDTVICEHLDNLLNNNNETSVIKLLEFIDDNMSELDNILEED